MTPTPTQTPPKSNLATKILAVMASVGTVKKDKKNDFHNYQYASDEAIVGAVREALIVNRLAIVSSQKSCVEISQKTAKGEEQILTKLEVEFELIDADSGESKCVIGYGYGSDKADKGIYKAATGAEKYFLMKTFLIATPDDPEFEKNKAAAAAAFRKPAPPVPARPPIVNPATPPAPARQPTMPPAAPAAVPAAPAPGAASRGQITCIIHEVKKFTPAGKEPFYRVIDNEGASYTTWTEADAIVARKLIGCSAEMRVRFDPKGNVMEGIKPA